MRGVVAVDGDDEGNRETRRSVVACLAPDRHSSSCSHVLVAPLLSTFTTSSRRQSNLLRSSKFQHADI